MIILNIFLVIVWIALVVGALIGTVAVCVDQCKSLARVAGFALLGMAVTATIIGLPFATGIINFGNGSEHCGPGTVYHSVTRIVGKTPIVEWQCDAK